MKVFRSPKKLSRNLFAVLLFMAVFIAACDGAEQQPGFGGPSVLIIAPEDGAVINTGDLVDIHSRISDPEGATNFFLVVNNEPVRQDQFTTPMRSGSIYQPWQPLEPGNYSIQVIMLDSQGNNQESNIINVQVGGELVAKEESPAEEASATSTPTLAEDTPTPTLTYTPTLSPAAFTADQNSNCRRGPDTVFNFVATILENQSVAIQGVGGDPYQAYWVVEVDGSNCWVWSELGVPSGDYLNVPVISSPPFPTATFTPTATDVPVALSAPVQNGPSGSLNCAAVTGGTTLQWSGVSHPNGIDHYEWQLTGALNESGNTGGKQASTSGLSCAGSNYQWRVRAVDGNGNIGPWSAYMAFDVP